MMHEEFSSGELSVHHWPSGGHVVEPQRGLLVASIDTPNTTDRTQARRRVRQATIDILAHHWKCEPEELSLHTVPGQPLHARRGYRPTGIGLSVSHDRGLSLLAVNLVGAIGVDVVRLPEAHQVPDWQVNIEHLTRDYLGPQLAQKLATLPSTERTQAFAKRWVAFEASLKCLGVGLSEWSEELQRNLDLLCHYTLPLPDGYVGSVVVRK